MACVPACPSGVRYDLLIERTRARVERDYARTPGDRAFRAMIFSLFPYPQRLRALSYALYAYARTGLSLIHISDFIAKWMPLRRMPLRKPALSPVTSSPSA